MRKVGDKKNTGRESRLEKGTGTGGLFQVVRKGKK